MLSIPGHVRLTSVNQVNLPFALYYIDGEGQAHSDHYHRAKTKVYLFYFLLRTLHVSHSLQEDTDCPGKVPFVNTHLRTMAKGRFQ